MAIIPVPSQKKRSRKSAQMVPPFPPFSQLIFGCSSCHYQLDGTTQALHFPRAVVGEAISILFAGICLENHSVTADAGRVWKGHGLADVCPPLPLWAVQQITRSSFSLEP